MKKIGIIIGILLNQLLVIQLLSGQDIKVKASLDTNSIKIGEQTTLSLKTNNPSGTKLLWPDINDTITDKIQIVEIAKKDSSTNTAGDNVAIRQQYLITSFDSGYHVIPAFYFVHQQDSFFTEAMLLEVKTLHVDTTESIKSIKDIRKEPLNWRDILPWFGAGILAVAVILLIVIYLRKRKRKQSSDSTLVKEQPSLPPYEEAMARLKELEKQKLWQQDQIKAYYVELTAIVRHYIERQYAVEAQELSSRETISQMKALVDKESINALSDLLQRADLVKFARYKPLSGEHEQSKQQAIQFLELTHQSLINQERKNRPET